jgi:hypothetical protein
MSRGATDGREERARSDVDRLLLPAIAVTLLCCLPTGIVALVNALLARRRLTRGDLAGAAAAVSRARTWTYVSFGLGLMIGVLSVLVVLVRGSAFGLALRG